MPSTRSILPKVAWLAVALSGSGSLLVAQVEPTSLQEASAVKERNGKYAEKTPEFPDGRFHDFGVVKKGTILKASFRIVNQHDTPLRIIDIRATSGRLNGFIDKKLLGPKEVAIVRISVDTRRFDGEKRMNLLVHTEAGEKREEIYFLFVATSDENVDGSAIQ